MPAYQARDVDEELRAAVTAALDGSGRWIVVVTGRSKVGKSRALFEALRACADGRAELVAPVDGDALRSLLTAGRQPRLRADRAVLWLDDLGPFLNQGGTLQTLRAWRAFAEGGIVAATTAVRAATAWRRRARRRSRRSPMRSSSKRRARSRSRRAHPASSPDCPPVFRRVSLRTLGGTGWRHSSSRRRSSRPSNTARHAPGQPESPQGLAAVHTAVVDWARCGRTDAIARETLRELSRSYLPAGPPAPAEAFDGALDWALLPVAGSIALLQPADASSYRAYDYVVRFLSQRPETPAPSRKHGLPRSPAR